MVLIQTHIFRLCLFLFLFFLLLVSVRSRHPDACTCLASLLPQFLDLSSIRQSVDFNSTPFLTTCLHELYPVFASLTFCNNLFSHITDFQPFCHILKIKAIFISQSNLNIRLQAYIAALVLLFWQISGDLAETPVSNRLKRVKFFSYLIVFV